MKLLSSREAFFHTGNSPGITFIFTVEKMIGIRKIHLNILYEKSFWW